MQSGSVSAYTRHRAAKGLSGKTHQAVARAIKDGRITAAILPDGKIDYALADKLWEENSRTRAPHVASVAGLEEVEQSGRATTAKARREEAEARLAEIKVAKEERSVLPADEVRKTITAIGRVHAAAREAIPAQLAPKLVGKTDLTEIERIIREELRSTDERVANEVESRFAEEYRSEQETDIEDDDTDGDGRSDS